MSRCDKILETIAYDKAAISRFWSKVSVGPDECCWEWTARKENGYGNLYIQGAKVKSHRISFTLAKGHIPYGMVVDHICRNRSCVNPKHLRSVDHKTNSIENSVSFAAKNSAKTACKRGHEFTEQNTRIRGKGWRVCRQCEREHSHKWYLEVLKPRRNGNA